MRRLKALSLSASTDLVFWLENDALGSQSSSMVSPRIERLEVSNVEDEDQSVISALSELCDRRTGDLSLKVSLGKRGWPFEKRFSGRKNLKVEIVT